MGSPPQGGILGILPIPVGLGGSLANGGGLPAAIHFWPMNEGTGSTFFDQIGTINLTAQNISWSSLTGMGPVPVAGFNGTNSSAVASAVSSSLNFNGTTSFSVAFWIDTPRTASETFFGNFEASGGTFTGFEITTGGASGIGLGLVNNLNTSDSVFYLDGSTQPTSATFLSVSYDGLNTSTSAKLYINGVSTALSGSGLVTTNFSSTQPFLVGSRNDGSNPYQGAMAYMRVWNQVLTPTQVSTLFASGPQ